MRVQRVLWIRVLLTMVISLTAWSALSAQNEDESSATTTAVGILEIADDGVFNVTFCGGGDFGQLGVTSSEGASGITTITLCYEDSELERDAFEVSVSSSDFESTTDGVAATIPATNLSVYMTYSPIRVADCDLEPFPVSVGAIYAISPSGNLGSVATQIDSHASAVWGENNLASPVVIGGGDAGRGTALCVGSSDGMTADIDLQLDVPAGQPAAIYQSTLELEINPPSVP